MFPLGDGITLIDTPGLRGVGMWDADAGIAAVFPEIDDLAQHCRFTGCAHETEPGCAVRAAVEQGDLDARRVESHRKLRRENEWVAARADAGSDEFKAAVGAVGNTCKGCHDKFRAK